MGMTYLFLDNYVLENESAISTGAMHSIGLLLAAKNGKSIRGFNDQHIFSQFSFIPVVNFLVLLVTIPITAVDLCVWHPGIGFGFMALTERFGGRRTLTTIVQYFEKRIDAKEEWNKIKDIAASISHLRELLPKNMTKFPYVAANSHY
ncbi:hypothetical protein KY285_033511 [Solanum tuberosum]|nr:hypothetical protein KY285_033511 [Solanum tuberosum]